MQRQGGALLFHDTRSPTTTAPPTNPTVALCSGAALDRPGYHPTYNASLSYQRGVPPTWCGWGADQRNRGPQAWIQIEDPPPTRAGGPATNCQSGRQSPSWDVRRDLREHI